MEQLERVTNIVDRIEESLNLLEESYATIGAIVKITNTRTVEMAKLGNICLSLFMLSIYNVVTNAKCLYRIVGPSLNNR